MARLSALHRDSRALGLPFRGRLVGGEPFPEETDYSFTWDFPEGLSPNPEWRRYGTEHALEVELGSFLVRTRAGLYAIYAKDWLFQPFVRDEESRDLLHEAAAFIGEKHRELAGRFGLDVPEGPGPPA